MKPCVTRAAFSPVLGGIANSDGFFAHSSSVEYPSHLGDLGDMNPNGSQGAAAACSQQQTLVPDVRGSHTSEPDTSGRCVPRISATSRHESPKTIGGRSAELHVLHSSCRNRPLQERPSTANSPQDWLPLPSTKTLSLWVRRAVGPFPYVTTRWGNQ